MAGNKGGKKLNLLLPWAHKEKKAGDRLVVPMAAKYLHGLALFLLSQVSGLLSAFRSAALNAQDAPGWGWE